MEAAIARPIKRRNNPKFELMKQRLLELINRLCKNPRKECYALTNTLAKILGRSRRQIFRYLSALINEGKIKTRTVIIEATDISFKTFRFISLGASKMFKENSLLDLKPISSDPYLLRKISPEPKKISESERLEAEKRAKVEAEYAIKMAEVEARKKAEKEAERLDNIRQDKLCMSKDVSEQEAYERLVKIYGDFDIKVMNEPPSFWPDNFKEEYLKTGNLDAIFQS